MRYRYVQAKQTAGDIDTSKRNILLKLSLFTSETYCFRFLQAKHSGGFLQAKHSHHSKWRFCKLKIEKGRRRKRTFIGNGDLFLKREKNEERDSYGIFRCP